MKFTVGISTRTVPCLILTTTQSLYKFHVEISGSVYKVSPQTAFHSDTEFGNLLCLKTLDLKLKHVDLYNTLEVNQLYYVLVGTRLVIVLNGLADFAMSVAAERGIPDDEIIIKGGLTTIRGTLN